MRRHVIWAGTATTGRAAGTGEDWHTSTADTSGEDWLAGAAHSPGGGGTHRRTPTVRGRLDS
ncbi:hypothetical protein F8271_07560 [Micromonospora sp. ALFpr18c]|uniref:hypothetical protein n=1 Tax=unclassified Micromonospora TaxID=2617518 RepID=UPI00124B3362|nr:MULTISPECIES: hypothetical protein [unclassified Micromonospora]KAB1946053.1 hypothetical protein F8271_07560 [Micromonospora sp. ALFpr18c]MDG4758107.1 hypothetical protein [Micromonospora sp. WMMD710]